MGWNLLGSVTDMKFVILGGIAGGLGGHAGLTPLGVGGSRPAQDGAGRLVRQLPAAPLRRWRDRRTRFAAGRHAGSKPRTITDRRPGPCLGRSHRSGRRYGPLRRLPSGRQVEVGCDKPIHSPGAAPIRPKLTGVALPGMFTLRDVLDADLIRVGLPRERYRRRPQALPAVPSEGRQGRRP